MDISKLQIILASSSPRRIDILEKNHINPFIIPPQVNENLSDHLTMAQAVMFLALKKALWAEQEWLSLAKQKKSEKIPVILAADTVVYKNKIIGKPTDFQNAVDILKALRNTNHQVSTGVALIQPGTNNRRVFYETTEVFFKDYTNHDIIAYVNSGEAFGKAGAYAIQGTFGKHVSHITGDYDNVVGLPWTRLKEELTKVSLSSF
jgi:septum formation protein